MHDTATALLLHASAAANTTTVAAVSACYLYAGD